MSENRISQRNRTFLPANIEIAELGVAATCTIRDISETGARIQLTGSAPLPESFTLYIPRFDRRTRVRIVWRRLDMLGLAFEVETAEAVPKDAPRDGRYVDKLEHEISRLKLLLESIRADPSRARLLLDEAA